MKNCEPIIAVLCGGTSSEREVSIGSGAASAVALARVFSTRLFTVDADEIPAGLDPRRHVVFSTVHGTFGEDGGMQRLLDAAGVTYAGCDAAGSALTMDKAATKAASAACGITVAAGLSFAAAQKTTADEVIAALGDQVVVKPNDQGSSVGLTIVTDRSVLVQALAVINDGNWLIEKRLVGRELSVGVVQGKAMGVVEIKPKSGVYDFASKYTKGATQYFAPAPLSEELALSAQKAAEIAYAACGCRDYARVDFILCEQSVRNALYLLEINTLPGMKETSLLPMSARCVGLDFTELVRELVNPAVQRFHLRAAAERF